MTPLLSLLLPGFLLLGLASPAITDGSLEKLTNGNTDFAAKLYQAVASRTDDNVCLSTFALSTALSALLSATSGPTQEQLLQGLGLTGLDAQMLPELFQNLRTAIQPGNITNLKQAVALLPSHNFEVSASLRELVQTKFGGYMPSLKYTDQAEAISTINRWAQDQTGDQIQQVVTAVDAQTELLLATVSYYKTQFSPLFNASLTQDERFYVNKYVVVMVPMMFRADKYFLAYDRSLKVGVLKLPMGDSMAMLVVLPDEDVDIIVVEEKVTGEKIRGWIRQLKKTKLEVQLPRFMLEKSYALRDVLQTLNMNKMFQDDADIIEMGSKGPKLTQVYQKSAVFVGDSRDEVATAGGASTFSYPPPRLTINRPFLFIIYHQTIGSVLFMGRVTNPIA
ncbi:protein Z-dependent protease inhibitor-like [Takifugu rubripes]|uniref:protein Z-dependent protease inhibitor-like n=1 Tax=Takifugu rubripes TaxID=31033 RepID=UPI000298E6D4|nr:protein Z-dependent protease inhibitor-like [Takifugu rubripes]|eukprot:XP_003971497.1 PREDICTED: protein Z-dependent protease inhibitor-like [Takifugu rubripes]